MTSLLSPDQINELARRIGDHEITATLAGCNDSSIVSKWMTGEAMPDPLQTTRLAFAHEWSMKILNDQTFKLWLIAPVPLPERPGTIKTAEAIGRDRLDLVAGRARHIVCIQY